MPAVALVGAYASISAGIAAGAATLLGGLQIAAGVMTGLGALTGNKKLMTIGAIASLGAGAYSALSGGSAASSASGLESVGGEGVAMGTAAGNAGSNAVEMGFADLAGGSDLGAAASGVSGGNVAASALGPAGESISTLNTPASAAASEGGLVQQALGRTDPAGAISNAARSGTAGTESGLPAVSGPQAQAIDKLSRGAEQSDGLIATALNKLNATAQYLKGNPEVTKLGMSTIGGLAGSYMKQQELEEAVRQAELRRARYNASIINQRA